MDQRVFLRLENGEIVAFDEAAVSGTSYVVQEDCVNTNTSFIVEKGAIPESANSDLESRQDSTPGYVEAAVLDNVAVENDGAESIVYIVQQEGANHDDIQYTVVGEGGSIDSTFAIQADDSTTGSEKPSGDGELACVQDLSGIETLSRVATEEIAGSLVHGSAELGNEIGNGTIISKLKGQIETCEKRNEDVKICFSCHHCGDTFEQLAEFRLHLKNEHEGEEMENEVTLFASCDVCSQTFVDFKELEAHMKVHSGNVDNKTKENSQANSKLEKGSSKCSICDACFDDKSKLVRHIKNEHSRAEPKESSSSSFTKCPYCHKMYVARGSNRALIKHVRSAHPGKSIEDLLSQDEKDEQLEEKIFCSACGFGFYWRNSLIRHMKFRHPKLFEERGEEMFAELGIQSVQNIGVKHRRSVNDGNGDFLSCPKCPKKFLWIKSLNRHIELSHGRNEKSDRSSKKEPVVFCCPHCSLVSKYACAVRKHMERKHPQLIKDIDITTVQLPTMEAGAAMDIEFKTVDRRPAEVRLNFCPVIFRCPFCTYASKQGSNLIRHLTSVKHGNIFTFDELKEIGITSFKVTQDLFGEDGEEKLDGTLSKKLPKLKLKGQLLDIVMQKYEILKQRKQENKENGIHVEEEQNEEDFSDMEIDNILDLAENESEESFDEEDEEENLGNKLSKRKETKTRRKLTRTKVIETAKGAMLTKGKNESKTSDKVDSAYATDEKIDTPKEKHLNEGVKNKSKNLGKQDSIERKGGTLATDPGERICDDSIMLDNEIDDDIPLYIENDVPCSEAGNTEGRLSIMQRNMKDKVTSDIEESSTESKETDIVRKGSPTKLVETKNNTENKADEKAILTGGKHKQLPRGIEGPSKCDSRNTVPFPCEICKKEFRDFEAFKQHLPSHVNLKVFFRCIKCSSEFPFLNDLMFHLLRDHDIEGSDCISSCFHTEAVKMDSKQLTTYDCPYCEMLFSQASTLQQHVLMDHAENIESANIKCENTSPSIYKAIETIISTFNCKYCECVYHNINDMVRHMHVIHRDVDKSDLDGSNVRKSGRKRRLPKWLEESEENSNGTKRAKKMKITESSNSAESTLSDQRRKIKPGAQEIGTENIDNRSKKTTRSDDAKGKDLCSPKNDKKKVSARECLKTGKGDSEQTQKGSKQSRRSTVSSRNEASRLEDNGIPKVNEVVSVSTGLLEGGDKSEHLNRCPHCDYIAKRSSALAFHINLKHGLEKSKVCANAGSAKQADKQSVNSMETQTEEFTELGKSPHKVKDRSDKLVKKETITEDTLQTLKDKLDNKIEQSPKKAKHNVLSTSLAEAIVVEVTENEFEMQNNLDGYDIEYGDSDDDYKPEKDEESSRSGEEFEFEDHPVKGRIPVKTKKRKRLDNDLYKCTFCDVVKDSKDGIVSHIRTQHLSERDIKLDDIVMYKPKDGDTLQKLFRCPYCELKSSWKAVILKHVNSFHLNDSGNTVKLECNTEIVRKDMRRKYQCVYCYWQYDQKAEVLTHIAESHPDQLAVTEGDIYEVDIADKVDNQFQCPYCDQQSKYKRCIVRHVSRAHKDKKGFTKSDVICLSTNKSRNSASEGLFYLCPYCDYDSMWKQCIRRHVDNYHPEVVDFDFVPSEIRKKSLLDLDDLLQGSHVKHDQDYFKCPYCDAVSETKSGVVVHVRNQHPKKAELKYSHIEKVIWNEDVNRGEDLAYKCPACESGSMRKKTVVLHMKMDHPEVKKFHVQLCKATLKKSGDELNPLLMCRICNELFSSTRSASAHALLVHETEQQIVVETIPASRKVTNIFKCVYCNHKSSMRSAIVDHAKIHHPAIVNFSAKDVMCELREDKEGETSGGYQCLYCNTVNHWKKSIIRHMKTVHPNERHDLEIHFNPTLSVKPGGRSSRKSCKQINCLKCGLSCRSVEKMRKHFASKHPKFAQNFLNKENTEFFYESGRFLDFVCVLCNAKYMWKKSLLTHVKNRHKDVFDVYQALDHMVDIVACATGPVNTAIKFDQSEAAKPNVAKDTVLPGRCEKCGKVFKTEWAASVHRRLKHGRQSKHRFKCSKCSVSFINKSLLLQHRIRYHRNKKSLTILYCNVSACAYRCRFSKMLSNHYKTIHNLNIPVSGTSTFTKKCQKTASSGRCEICLRDFTSAEQLKQHISLHKKQRRVRFQCGTCQEHFLTNSLRDSHIVTFHPNRTEVMCDICGALCHKSFINDHMKTHDEGYTENTQCPYCGKAVTTKMFNKHILQEHQDILNCQCEICNPIGNDDSIFAVKFTCTLCKQSFCQKHMLYIHNKLQHTDTQKSKLFYCDACPDVFLTKTMKEAHCHEHHKKRMKDEARQVSVSRSTNTQHDIDPTTHVIHIGQDEGRQFLPKLSESSMNAVIKELVVIERGVENAYKCLLCGRSFSKSKYIKLHIRRAHVKDEDQPYRCKVCGSGFVRLTEFRKHSRSHSDFRPYKCRYCDKAFKQQANLRDHYRVHTNTKEYECYICKTEFKQRGGLTSHVVFHDTLKPFKCMYCQKGFTTRGELSRHMQKYNKDDTQSSEKSYPCHICEETFPHYPMLLKHIDAHNPEKPFQCVVCQDRFANYVSMYFHKVKEEHFLLDEIQAGMNDLQKRGRKFRAKKNLSKIQGPEIVYANNPPVTETVYVAQPDAYAENEPAIKPVEVIIEGFGKDQVVRVQENEPEHEELLSIAKQLTELSGFQGAEYYTPTSNKKNTHQEEDEIIKDMLDADEEVLATLSKPSNMERADDADWKKEEVEENNEYLAEIKEDVTAMDESVAKDDGYEYVNTETDNQVMTPASSVPTNMDELVSLVSENSSGNTNEQVMAYQSEDGSIIYICLPEGQNLKSGEIDAQETTNASDVIAETYEPVGQEPESTDYNMECTETAEDLYEGTGETVTEQTLMDEDARASANETASISTSNIDIIHIPVSQQADSLSGMESTENTCAPSEQINEKVISSAEYSVMHPAEMQSVELNEVEMTPEQFITPEQDLEIASEQQSQTENQLENAFEQEDQNYTIGEYKGDNNMITIQPQETTTGNSSESNEELIQRSHLARHLTGNIQPMAEKTRIQTHLIVTEQGLQSISRFEPLVSQESENIANDLINITATTSDHTNEVAVQDQVSSSSYEQGSLIRQGESYVEGEETLVEYQIDESRFIKEELLDADYSGMSEKDREVMFFSDNIYTYSHMEKKFICLHCGAKIGTFKNLKNHIRRHAPMNTRTHACTFCPKRFVTKNELKRHLCTHTGERNYECKDCGKKFIQPGHLQEHRRLHTGQKPFPCTECDAAFITKSQLVLHFSRLHSSNEIPCNICEKVFKNTVDLRRHKGLEHAGNKTQTSKKNEQVGEHVCDICGHSFHKKASLKRHLEKHNLEELDESEKPQELFECEECGMSFKSKYYVKEHIKVAHTEEKNEICDLCGMGFKTRSILRRHKLSKHSGENGTNKWHCNICNKSLGSKYAYGYHMGSKHPNVCSDD